MKIKIKELEFELSLEEMIAFNGGKSDINSTNIPEVISKHPHVVEAYKNRDEMFTYKKGDKVVFEKNTSDIAEGTEGVIILVDYLSEESGSVAQVDIGLKNNIIINTKYLSKLM